MRSNGWGERVEVGCGLLVVVLFLVIILYAAFTGQRQPLPAGAADPRIYPAPPLRPAAK
jgi:hypothetical protein